MMAGSMNVHAQKARNRRMGIKTDSIIQVKDSLVIDSLKLLEERQKIENMEAPVDTAALVRKNDSIQKAMAAETKPRFIPQNHHILSAVSNIYGCISFLRRELPTPARWHGWSSG